MTLRGPGSGEATIVSTADFYGIRTGSGLTDVTLEGFTLQYAGSGKTYGIKVESVTGLLINDVVVEGFSRSGIDLHDADGGTLTGVESNGNGGNGIAITDSRGITIDGAAVSGNAWGGIALYSAGTFFAAGVSDITISGSTISGHASPGIYAQYSGPYENIQVSGNDIVGNAVGVFIEYRLPLGQPDASAFRINGNNISGNSVAGVANQGANTLNAAGNWWGHASGPGGSDGRKTASGKAVGKGDGAEGDVAWAPWLPQPVGLTPTGPTPPGLGK